MLLIEIKAIYKHSRFNNILDKLGGRKPVTIIVGVVVYCGGNPTSHDIYNFGKYSGVDYYSETNYFEIPTTLNVSVTESIELKELSKHKSVKPIRKKLVELLEKHKSHPHLDKFKISRINSNIRWLNKLTYF
jgi:hypothetical protein